MMPEVPEFVRQRLAQAGGGDHPDADVLAAFAENCLSAVERSQVLEHLGWCATCRDVVALACPLPAQPAAAPPSGRTPWLRWPMLRWAGAAAAVVIVAAAVSLRKGELARVAVDQRVSDHLSQADGDASSKAAARAVPPLQDLQAKEQPPPKQRRQKAARSAAGNSADALSLPMKPHVPTAPRVEASNEGAADRLQRSEQDAFVFKKQMDKNLDGSVAGIATSPGTRGKDAAATAETQAPYGGPVMQQKLPTSSQAVSSAIAGYGPSQKQMNQAPASQAASSAQPPAEAKAKGKAERPEETLEARANAGSAGQLQRQAEEAETAELRRDEPSAKTTLGRSMNTLRRASATTSWRVSTEGALERSGDGGLTWQTVPVRTSVGLSEASYILSGFRAVSAVGQQVWAAGARGALYRSDNAGVTWTRVTPKSGDRLLLADVVRVEFIDPQHGTLTTDTGEVWTTTDGGATWSVRRP